MKGCEKKKKDACRDISTFKRCKPGYNAFAVGHCKTCVEETHPQDDFTKEAQQHYFLLNLDFDQHLATENKGSSEAQTPKSCAQSALVSAARGADL